MDDADSIRRWLDDEVKAGYGAKYASAFEEVGFEDKGDLHDVNDASMAELVQELRACGAKTVQVDKIKKAIEAIVSPAMATRAKLAAKEEDDVALIAETNSAPGLLALREQRGASAKPYACFLSHHKLACAMEARFLKGELERMLGAEIFLDSDDLKDLRKLGQHVIDSDVLVLLQSSEVLLRPWCIFELHTAIEHGIPIVAVVIESKAYDFAKAGKLMLHLDTILELENPGASTVLLENGIDLKLAAWKISSTIPNVISVPFNPSGSQNNITGSLLDLVEGIHSAVPVPLEKSYDDWLAARGDTPVSSKPHGAATGAGTRELAHSTPLPPEVPDLPRGYLVRDTILESIRRLLFSDATKAAQTAHEEAVPSNAPDQNGAVVTVQGMGGSGKTVTAAALVFDPAVRARFDVVCFLTFGQNPVLRDLQKVLHVQLTGKKLDSTLASEEVLRVIADAAKGKNVLCVLDDVWTKEHYHPWSRLLDTSTFSRLLVTTRVKALVVGAAQFELGLLSPDDSVKLMLECAGEKATIPYPAILYKAVEMCGHLPLVLSIAAGILEQQFSGVVDDSFIALLSADHKEVLREGEHGDELVSIEDR